MKPELPQDLSKVVAHLEAAYPDEGCGVLLRTGRGEWISRPMQNVYNRYHAQDPLRFPRTARTAYLFDPKEWLAVCEEADRLEGQVACVFHSHGDAGAYFSEEDKAMAAPDGEPVLPGVVYLVVAVDKGKATGAKAFLWEGAGFVESNVRL